MLGLIGKVESGYILVTNDVVRGLGRPFEIIGDVSRYSLPPLDGVVIEVRPSRKPSLPHEMNIIAPNRSLYERALGTLPR
jgi:hypothetical protein